MYCPTALALEIPASVLSPILSAVHTPAAPDPQWTQGITTAHFV